MAQDAEADDVRRLRACANEADRQQALAEFFMSQKERLRLMIDLRLDPRLKGRVDPSDVLQESFLEVSQRLGEYLRDVPMPLLFWIRRITAQKLLALHRYHLFTAARDARHEIRIQGEEAPEASSNALAERLARSGASPSDRAMAAEAQDRLKVALDAMEPVDREIIALRHFEQLPNREVARLLGIEEYAATRRYFKALEKLKKILEAPERGHR